MPEAIASRLTALLTICPGDLIYHDEGNKKALPVVKYPDECWYCGLCQSICPVDAINIVCSRTNDA